MLVALGSVAGTVAGFVTTLTTPPRLSTMYCALESIQSTEPPRPLSRRPRLTDSTFRHPAMEKRFSLVPPSSNQYHVSGSTGSKEPSKFPGTFAHFVAPVCVDTMLFAAEAV